MKGVLFIWFFLIIHFEKQTYTVRGTSE